MPLAPETLTAMIKEAFPDADISLQDTRGDADHYALVIRSRAFEGLSRIQQHQAVYKALKGTMGGVLHALSLTTLPLIDAAGAEFSTSSLTKP